MVHFTDLNLPAPSPGPGGRGLAGDSNTGDTASASGKKEENKERFENKILL